MKKPVAFIIFNRPDTTKIVFEEIRKYTPEQLFVIADGPRNNKLNEDKLCQETRNLINVDWPCEVTLIYSDENLGCQQRIYTGLNEVFNNVEEAIILEDDCVPHESFFTYCEDLLEYYKDNEKIMAISGDNFQSEDFKIEESYYYSIYPHCWGWATWKRAWSKMDVEMKEWQNYKHTIEFENFCFDAFFKEYWEGIFDSVEKGKIDSWAYPWTFTCWINNGLTVLPNKNLVSNIGFDERGTHTTRFNDASASLPFYEMKFPIKHPKNILHNFQADFHTAEHHFNLSQYKKNTLIKRDMLNFINNVSNIEQKYLNKEIYLFGAGNWAHTVKEILEYKGVHISNFIVTKKESESNKIVQIDEVEFNDSSLIIVCVEGHHDKEIVKKLCYQFDSECVEVYSWRDFI